MDPAEIARFVQAAFEGVEVLEANGDTFFFVGDQPADQRMPFATIVTSDAHDRASDLNRPGVFRLNIGISRGVRVALRTAAARSDHRRTD